MLQPTRVANAAAAASVILQIIYLIVVVIAPNLLYGYVSSMAPGYELSAIQSAAGVSLGFALLGILLVGVTTWLFAYITVKLYNCWTN